MTGALSPGSTDSWFTHGVVGELSGLSLCVPILFP